ncbi:MAG: S-layer homology domain-containing protein [Chloroflexota bacterium]
MQRLRRIIPALSAALILAVVMVLGVLLNARSDQGASQRPLGPITSGQNGVASSNAAAHDIWTNPPSANGIMESEEVAPALSPPLRSLPAAEAGRKPKGANENERIPLYNHVDGPDSVIQSVLNPAGALAPAAMPAPIRNFEGMNLATAGSGIPPDTNGEVGPNHYVQMVNSAIQIWDKSGNPLISPVDINALWSSAGGQCAARNDGDPIVLYDQLADRWLLSQFTAEAPYNECIAISQTGDPTGTYWVYSFFMSNTVFPDYPHFGMWPDGYYMGVNEFNGNTYAGGRPYVFERSKMLLGQNANVQTNAGPLGPSSGLAMPADLDGTTPPPAGAPNPFSLMGDPLQVFKFHVDWANPGSSTWSGPTNIDVANFTAIACQYCIPQPGTTTRLDAIGDRFMYRAAYRNFGSHESLLLLHNVDAGGYAGERWYELRNVTGAPTVFQQGTFAPADNIHRWMGSIAMDASGNIAMGYTVSSGGTGATVYPGVRYAGRLAGDPAGTMAQGEATLFSGSGSQVGIGRWGDYSDMTVDPTDDCTFWYTNEYNNSNDQYWNTRIGSFKFPGCSSGPPPPTPTPIVCTPGVYTDVAPGSTFYPFVSCLSSRGIIGGYSDCTFRPQNNVTRGQLSKIVANAAGFSDPAGAQMFQDVAPGSTFYDFVQRLASRGYINGYACGGPGEPCVAPGNKPYFRTNSNATRGQISKIVASAAGFVDPAGTRLFQDVASGSTFYDYIQRLAHRTIINGYPCGGAGEPCGAGNLPYFRPNNNATRGQTSKIVANAFFPGCTVEAKP